MAVPVFSSRQYQFNNGDQRIESMIDEEVKLIEVQDVDQITFDFRRKAEVRKENPYLLTSGDEDT